MTAFFARSSASDRGFSLTIMSSAHCLNIPEILILICAQLSRASLASFARTNSRICGVALDALWRKQTSLIPLLRTLPQCEYDTEDGLVRAPVVPMRFL